MMLRFPGLAGLNPHNKTPHFGRSRRRILDRVAISTRKGAISSGIYVKNRANRGTLGGFAVKSGIAPRLPEPRAQIRTVKHDTFVIFSRHFGRFNREIPDRTTAPGAAGPNPHGKTRYF